MKKTELAYVAGIIDGEGCIGFKKYSYTEAGVTCSPRVQVNITEEYIPKWLQFSFGGHVYKRREKRQPLWKPIWVWQINGVEAVNFLKLALPYLKLKRAQAELLLQHHNEQYRPQGKHATLADKMLEQVFADKMHTLNRRGVADK